MCFFFFTFLIYAPSSFWHLTCSTDFFYPLNYKLGLMIFLIWTPTPYCYLLQDEMIRGHTSKYDYLIADGIFILSCLNLLRVPLSCLYGCYNQLCIFLNCFNDLKIFLFSITSCSMVTRYLSCFGVFHQEAKGFYKLRWTTKKKCQMKDQFSNGEKCC